MWASYRPTTNKYRGGQGFTIVELLIVIVVIGILAAITVVAYNGIQDRSRVAKINSDISQIRRAVIIARENASQTLYQVTGNGYTAANCTSKTAGTDLATLPKTDSCWVNYTNALTKISAASGVNLNGLVDPWNRPYFLDENEGENGVSCNPDAIAAYAVPTNGPNRYPNSQVNVPLSGLSGCS